MKRIARFTWCVFANFLLSCGVINTISPKVFPSHTAVNIIVFRNKERTTGVRIEYKYRILGIVVFEQSEYQEAR